MIFTVSIILTLLAATVEASFLPLPLTLLVVIVFAIFSKRYWVFLLAIIAGVALDSLSFRTLGENSLFFLTTVGVLFLYGRKFETDHVFFSTSFTLLVSAVYLVVFGSSVFIFSLISISVISFLVFGILFFGMRVRHGSEFPSSL